MSSHQLSNQFYKAIKKAGRGFISASTISFAESAADDKVSVACEKSISAC